PAPENSRRYQCNGGKQRRAVARILILKEQETEPAAHDPQENWSPARIKPEGEENRSGDKSHEKRQEQLIALHCAYVKDDSLKGQSLRVAFGRASCSVELQELSELRPGRHVPIRGDRSGDDRGDGCILEIFPCEPNCRADHEEWEKPLRQ